MLAGYPVVDIKATLYDGSYHEVDSSEMAFKIAASMALKDGVRKGRPQILEPIMKVEVTAPEDFMGTVIGDLNSRRGRVEGMEAGRQRAGRAGLRAAGQHVRLCHRPALDDLRAVRLLDGVRPLRGAAEQPGRGDYRQEPGADSVTSRNLPDLPAEAGS